MSDYNPNSLDSQIGRILERLDTQDDLKEQMHKENQVKLSAILAEQKLTNGRVTKLELFKRDMVKICVGVSLAVALIWKVAMALWSK